MLRAAALSGSAVVIAAVIGGCQAGPLDDEPARVEDRSAQPKGAWFSEMLRQSELEDEGLAEDPVPLDTQPLPPG